MLINFAKKTLSERQFVKFLFKKRYDHLSSWKWRRSGNKNLFIQKTTYQKSLSLIIKGKIFITNYLLTLFKRYNFPVTILRLYQLWT